MSLIHIRKRLALLLAAAFLVITAATPVAAANRSQSMPPQSGITPQSGTKHEFAPDAVIVKFTGGASERDRQEARARFGLETLTRHALTGTELMKIKGGLSVAEVVARLQALPVVLYAEPDYRLEAAATFNDPQMGNLWGLDNAGQVINGVTGVPDVDIDAPEAWDITQGTPDVVVAVIDTGVDISHPDLAANIWTNPGEIDGDGLDNDGNGFVDDVHGWDFYNKDSSVFDAVDGDQHGTHVSGTIAAVANNAMGVAGVAPNVRIMPIKFLGPNGGYTSDAIEAIQYAKAMGADLASNSWGGGSFSQALKDAIDAFDGVFVAAAGNDGFDNDASPHYPSSYDSANLIAVAAVDNRGALASFSNYGASSVDLGAPGVDVLSLAPGNAYAWASGTSMATPHVSGVAALMLSLNPSLTPLQVVDLLKRTAAPLASLAGKSVTGGMVNAHQAAMAARDAGPSVTSSDPADGATGVPLTQTVQVTFSEEVTPGNGFGNILLSDGTSAVAVANSTAGNLLTIDPTTDLQGDHTYTVTIPMDGITNLAGKPMAQPYSFTFATPDTVAPAVARTDPADGAAGVDPGGAVTVTFTEVVAEGPNFSGITVNGEPVNTGSYSTTLAGDNLHITAASGFAYGTTYVIDLPAGAVADPSGNLLAAPYAFQFTTMPDVLPPAVSGTNPEPGAINVATDARITVTFDEEVLAGTNYDGIELSAGGTPVAAAKGLRAHVLTLTPAEFLSANVTYTVSLPAGAVKDGVGNETTAPFTFSFTTSQFSLRKLPFKVADAVLDPDRPLIYLTSKEENRLYSVNYATGATAFLDLGYPTDALELGVGSHAGELYVALHNGVPDYYSVWPGWIKVVDRATFTVTDTISTGVDPYDIIAGRDGHLYVPSGTDQWTTLDSYDRTTMALADQTGIRHMSFGKLHPTLERIYTIDTDLSPRDYTAYNISAGLFTDPDYPGGYDSPYHGDYPLNKNFRIDPIGRYLFNGSGVIFTTAADQTQDMLYAAKLDAGFKDIAFEDDLSYFYTTPLTANVVQTYEGQGFMAGDSYALAEPAGNHLLRQGRQLFVLLAPASPTATYQSGIQIIDLPALPLRVTASNPAGGAVDVPVTQAITLQFNNDVTAGALFETISLTDSAGTPVTIQKALTGSTLTVTPVASLGYLTAYTLTVPATAVRDGAGGGLQADYSLSFTTQPEPDTVPPAVVSTTPVEGETAVPGGAATITVTFSEAIGAGTNYSGIKLSDSTGAAVSIGTSLSGSVLTVTAADLAYGTAYTLSLPAGAVQDLAGNPLAADFALHFTTGLRPGGPQVTGTTPVGGAVAVPVTQTIQVSFDRDIQLGDNAASITVMKGTRAVAIAVSISGNTLIIDPTADLGFNSTYTVTIPAGAVKDALGNPLAAAYTFSFTTEKR